MMNTDVRALMSRRKMLIGTAATIAVVVLSRRAFAKQTSAVFSEVPLPAVDDPLFVSFATSSSESLLEAVSTAQIHIGGDGAMWKGRMQAFLNSLLVALVWKRDHHGMKLDASVVIRHFDLDTYQAMANEETLGEHPKSMMANMLRAIPGYSTEKGVRRHPATIDQFGFLTMGFVEPLQHMAAMADPKTGLIELAKLARSPDLGA